MKKEYYEAHKEEIREQHHQYYLKNKEAFIAKARKWGENNPEKCKASKRKYDEQNKEKKLELQREWRKTPKGRATMLLSTYKTSDRKMGRGESDITPEWIVENIFSKPCVHCGETDWHKIGCNRLDNSKPHTKDNVEPCCSRCNLLLQKQPRNELGQFKQ